MSKPSTITLGVIFMGLVATTTGAGEEKVTMEDGASLQDLFDRLFDRYPSLGKQENLFFAVNKKVITGGRDILGGVSLKDGDEVMIGIKLIGG